MSYEVVARARVRREKACRPIGGIHDEIARGEMSIYPRRIGDRNEDESWKFRWSISSLGFRRSGYRMGESLTMSRASWML